MATGAMSRVNLITTDWTLLADGSAGVTDVIVQNNNVLAQVTLAIGTAAPSSAVTTGIVISNATQPFGRVLGSGVKLYGRAIEAACTVDVMTYNV